MKKVRWGIAGPGNIARKFATAANNLESVELCAVASRDPARGAAFAAEYGIPTVFSSYEEMAASPLVDCVYVATPHPFHKGCAEIFLKAGKHVLCEKPMCINVPQAEELIACARENDAFLMEAMWTRFLPATEALLAAIAAGEIGEVRGITADFCYNIEVHEDSKIFKPEMAGGGLLDVGVYSLHFAAMIMGTEGVKLSAAARVVDGCDRHTIVTAEYENGVLATLTSATDVQKPYDAYIYGSKGYIHVPNFYGAQGFTVVKGSKRTEYSYPSLGAGFEEEILEASRAVTEGIRESERHPLSRTLAVLRQMDEIRRAVGVRYPLPGEDMI